MAQNNDIPILTVSFASADSYEYIGFISAHVALGTGPFSQIFSWFSDLFGRKSETYNVKVKTAEKACLQEIKNNASVVGAEMVIGVTTTYTELTRGSGQLLVCMTGTAVKKRRGA